MILIYIYQFSEENPYVYMINAHSSQEDIDLATIELER
jgi:hypothetical protein